MSMIARVLAAIENFLRPEPYVSDWSHLDDDQLANEIDMAYLQRDFERYDELVNEEQNRIIWRQ